MQMPPADAEVLEVNEVLTARLRAAFPLFWGARFGVLTCRLVDGLGRSKSCICCPRKRVWDVVRFENVGLRYGLGPEIGRASCRERVYVLV